MIRHDATAVIAEDEEVLRSDLTARLHFLWPALRILDEAATGLAALSLVERHRPDVVFLDIEMPGLSGLQVAQQLSGRCHIVFITAYDAFAVSAFEQGAVDYILKPYDDRRLALAIRRIQERLAATPASIDALLRQLLLTARPREYLRWIKASRGNEVDFIIVADICYFQADAKYTCVYTESQEACIRRSIKDLAAELDPSCFWQIHRSTIVNVSAIQSVTRSFSDMHVRLRARKEYLPVSNAYKHLFRHM